MTNAELRATKYAGGDWSNTGFVGLDLKGYSFAKTKLHASCFAECALDYAKLADADADECYILDCSWLHATLPDGIYVDGKRLLRGVRLDLAAPWTVSVYLFEDTTVFVHIGCHSREYAEWMATTNGELKAMSRLAVAYYYDTRQAIDQARNELLREFALCQG